MRKQTIPKVQSALPFTPMEHFTPKLIELENNESGEVISLKENEPPVVKKALSEV